MCFGIDNEPGDAVLDHFRDCTAMPRNDRCAARHGLDHDQTEGLGPMNRKQQADGIA